MFLQNLIYCNKSSIFFVEGDGGVIKQDLKYAQALPGRHIPGHLPSGEFLGSMRVDANKA